MSCCNNSLLFSIIDENNVYLHDTSLQQSLLFPSERHSSIDFSMMRTLFEKKINRSVHLHLFNVFFLTKVWKYIWPSRRSTPNINLSSTSIERRRFKGAFSIWLMKMSDMWKWKDYWKMRRWRHLTLCRSLGFSCIWIRMKNGHWTFH